MKDDASTLPYEHTLSLNALFAPDGRGALGAGADAVGAIFSEIQTGSVFRARAQLNGKVGQRERAMRPVTHVNDASLR